MCGLFVHRLVRDLWSKRSDNEFGVYTCTLNGRIFEHHFATKSRQVYENIHGNKSITRFWKIIFLILANTYMYLYVLICKYLSLLSRFYSFKKKSILSKQMLKIRKWIYLIQAKKILYCFMNLKKIKLRKEILRIKNWLKLSKK